MQPEGSQEVEQVSSTSNSPTKVPAGGLVPLSTYEGPASVAESIALTDARVRAHISYAIAGAFVLANVLTLAGVAYIFHEDNANIVAGLMAKADRVITPRVVMTIIGATTVQLGALAFTMGKYLYPAPPQPSLLQRIKG